MDPAVSPTSPLIARVPVDQPGRVQSLTVLESTLTSVKLGWTAPPSASSYFSAGMQYLVSYVPITVASDGSITPLGNRITVGTAVDLFTTVTSLSFGTIYSFRVQARNNNALGYEAGTTIIATPVRSCNASMCAVRNVRKAAYGGQLASGSSQVRHKTLTTSDE